MFLNSTNDMYSVVISFRNHCFENPMSVLTNSRVVHAYLSRTLFDVELVYVVPILFPVNHTYIAIISCGYKDFLITPIYCWCFCHMEFTTLKHRWESHVLHYHKIMVIYPYSFLVVVTQWFSWIIFFHYCICILTG